MDFFRSFSFFLSFVFFFTKKCPIFKSTLKFETKVSRLFQFSNNFNFLGYARRNSLEPEIRRRTASLSTPHRASDIQVDPDQAAMLFRDARGVSQFVNKQLTKIQWVFYHM